jgi:hypothetical protein
MGVEKPAFAGSFDMFSSLIRLADGLSPFLSSVLRALTSRLS